MRLLDGLADLRDDAMEYLSLRWTAVRLRAVSGMSDGLGSATGWILAGVFGVGAIVFMMVALALWIGRLTGDPAMGFLIAGGGMLLLAAAGFFIGRAVVRRAAVRRLASMFFTDDDYYGTQD